jgi:hypothetical protein
MDGLDPHSLGLLISRAWMQIWIQQMPGSGAGFCEFQTLAYLQ